MSSAQAITTPRKRKSVGDAITPARSSTRLRGPPTPNPPLAPFPTPPRSGRRTRVKVEHGEEASADVEGEEYDDDERSRPEAGSSRKKAHAPLPPHLQHLMSLHSAFNLALSLHIASNPPVLPPHASDTVKLAVPNITNLLSVRSAVEQAGRKRFGQAELQRLAWLWTWDGETLPSEKAVSVSDTNRPREEENDTDNPFLVSPKPGASEPTEVIGLSYLISPTRTLDPLTSRKVYTYGIGIELDLKPGETRQILLNGGTGGMGNKGQGGGTGALGRWNVAGDERERVVRSRLERWVELHGGYEPPYEEVGGLPTPTTSSNTRSTIPPIPLLPLPSLPSAMLPSLQSLGASSAGRSAGGGLFGPALQRRAIPAITKPASAAGLSDPFELDESAQMRAKVVRKGTIDERKAAMAERLKARSSANRPLPTLGSSIALGPPMSALETQVALKRRSTLSRLEAVAEAVWMMFSGTGPAAGSAPGTPGRDRRKAIPMDEAVDTIVMSSKTPISTSEARSSLQLLSELCPFFLSIKTVARQDWIQAPLALSSSTGAAQSSPGQASITRFQPGSVSAVESPSSPILAASPRLADGSTLPAMPETPKSKVRVASLGGPTSPGRVRRTAGLREVRERIRRELGE